MDIGKIGHLVWVSIAGDSAAVSEYHPTGGRPQRGCAGRGAVLINTRICSRLTTLTFRGHGNLPRKPTQSAAEMV